jgi:hypothetical protein
MNIERSKAEYKQAADDFKTLRSSLKIMGGPQLQETVLEPVQKVLSTRSALVRDVTLARVQGIIEADALLFLSNAADPEEKAKATTFLSENPASYLRALTARIVKELRGLEVDKKLIKIADEL